jgi:hypothetical protein
MISVMSVFCVHLVIAANVFYLTVQTELEFLTSLWGLGRGLSYRPARLHRLAEFIP